jgi:hypothetical protein
MTTTTRRALMSRVGLAVGAGLIAPELSLAEDPQSPAASSAMSMTDSSRDCSQSKRPWYELNVTSSALLDNKLLWYLSHTAQDMADIGEVLETATRIDSDPAWYPAWLKTANRVQGYAEDCQRKGHRLSAGQTYFRAANYYRAALIQHVVVNEADTRRTAELAKDCFDRAVQLVKIPARYVQVPFEGGSLPAYFVRSPHAASRAPTIVLHQGLDAWPEESWGVAAAALERGYHVLLLHGPGQGLALWLQKLYFRPDWEKVVTPAVDFALAQPGVDPGRIILYGLSFGGYLAPRAAAFEHRLRVCVANPGVLNWYESMTGHFPPSLRTQLDEHPEKVNALFDELGRKNPGMKFSQDDIKQRYGASTAADLFQKLRQYNNEPYVHQIKCETLVMDGDGEVFMKGQAKKFYDALTCPKDFMRFTAQDTALLHCQTGATLLANQRLFDWLDTHVT